MRTTNHAANQEKILAFIREEIQTKGYPPSVREICSAVGFRSPSTVHGYLTRLEEAGLIHRDPTKPRAMTLAEGPSSVPRTAPQTQKVPLVGKVTAGQPILAMENIEDELVVPAEWAGNGTVFALRVEGESMVEAGIFDGDVLLVRQQNTAENGQIVIAMIEDEATVKRIYYEPERVRLQPENRFMEPIYADEVTVLGLVVGLYRAF